MMMFMYKAIDGLDVQGPMHNGVEEIKDQKQQGERQNSILPRSIRPGPQEIGFDTAVLKEKVHKGTSLDLAQANKQLIFE